MDQKLLQALNNVGLALESLVDALESKKEASTPTAEVMKSGNFGKQLEVITAKIGEIKSNTEKILKNQETIIAISKEKESDKKTKDIEEAGGAKKNADIKKGVGTILLIATAVLAIGFAFKLVGDVNVLSVIALALAITIITTAFEKVALMGLTIKDAEITSLTLVMISVALALSSIALSFVQPISLPKLSTAIMIAGAFVVLSPSIHKMIGTFKDLSWIEIGKAAIGLVFVMPAIALGIALASEALQLVKPIGLVQFFSAVMIAAVFAVVSYGIRNMLNAFKGIDTLALVQSVIFLPLILPAIALGLALASQAFKLIQPIGFSQFFSAVMVGLVFVVLSFGLKKIIGAFKGLDPATAVVASFMIPILFTAMSIAIWKSSELLSQVIPIGLSQFLTTIAISFTFVIIAYALSPVIKLIDEMEWSSLIKLPVLFTVMSVAIMLSSHILSLMAPMNESQMIQAAILGGTLSIIALVMTPVFKAMDKIGVGEILKGGLAIVIIAGVVMVASHILAIGDYSNYPDLGWVTGVGLSLLTFGIGAFTLGALVFGPQALIFLAGLGAVLGVAGTIVGVSKILSGGQYNNPGMLEWAKATSLLYATFTPIMLILGTTALASAVVSIFGPNPWKMAQSAMIDVADTIVQVSYKLQEGNYSQGPTKEWAESIAIAIGAFAPVYKVLAENSGWLSSGVSVEGMKSAIMTISEGIVSAAKFFADNTSPFEEGKYPSKNWSEGVGAALASFAPVFDMLMKNSGFWKTGESVVKDMIRGIIGISMSIVKTATIFTEASKGAIFDYYPSNNWSSNVRSAVEKFVDLVNYLDKNKAPYWMVKDIARRIVSVAKILHGGSEFFSKSIDPNYISNVSKNMMDFNELVKKITDSESESMLSKFTNNLLGTDPIMQIARRMVTLAEGYDKLAESLTKLGFAMKILNINDVKSLGGLTKELISPGSISDTGKQISGQIENKTSTTSVKTGEGNLTGAVGGGLAGDKKIEQQLEEIIKLLTNIDKSSESLDSSISQKIGDEDPKKEIAPWPMPVR